MNGFLPRGFKFAAKRKTVVVEVPELECKIILKALSIGQLEQLDNDITNQLALMIVDEQGERIYTTEAEIAELREMDSQIALLLINEASTLNGATAQAVDEALKNSAASRNGDLVSA